MAYRYNKTRSTNARPAPRPSRAGKGLRAPVWLHKADRSACLLTLLFRLANNLTVPVSGIVTYAVRNGLREDGATLTLRGVVPRHKKGHIPAITKPADIGPLALAIDAYKSTI